MCCGYYRRNIVFRGKMQEYANKELQMFSSEGARNTLMTLPRQAARDF